MQIDCASMLTLLTLIERDARNARELFVLAQVQRQRAQAHRVVAGRFVNGGIATAGQSPEQMAQAVAAMEGQASGAVQGVMANAQALRSMLEGDGQPEGDVLTGE